jgi:hypothetical protein
VCSILLPKSGKTTTASKRPETSKRPAASKKAKVTKAESWEAKGITEKHIDPPPWTILIYLIQTDGKKFEFCFFIQYIVV